MLVATTAAGAETVIPDVCDGDGAALQVYALIADSPSEAPAPALPSHDLHLCHCSHTHAVMPNAALRCTAIQVSDGEILRDEKTRPAGHVPEAPLRPPAA